MVIQELNSTQLTSTQLPFISHYQHLFNQPRNSKQAKENLRPSNTHKAHISPRSRREFAKYKKNILRLWTKSRRKAITMNHSKGKKMRRSSNGLDIGLHILDLFLDKPAQKRRKRDLIGSVLEVFIEETRGRKRDLASFLDFLVEIVSLMVDASKDKRDLMEVVELLVKVVAELL